MANMARGTYLKVQEAVDLLTTAVLSNKRKDATTVAVSDDADQFDGKTAEQLVTMVNDALLLHTNQLGTGAAHPKITAAKLGLADRAYVIDKASKALSLSGHDIRVLLPVADSNPAVTVATNSLTVSGKYQVIIAGIGYTVNGFTEGVFNGKFGLVYVEVVKGVVQTRVVTEPTAFETDANKLVLCAWRSDGTSTEVLGLPVNVPLAYGGLYGYVCGDGGNIPLSHGYPYEEGSV